MRFVVAIALSAVLVGACGKGIDTDADLPRFDVPAEADRAKFLENFVLLDPDGNQAPHFDASSGKAPFGALVYMPLTGKGAYCSLTHFREGQALTNAHCVEDDSDASNYFVVFYTRDGQKKAYRIGNFIDVGSSENQDYALLQLSNRTAREFDFLDPQLIDTSADIDRQPPAVRKISIWSYDPLFKHAAEYSRYNSQTGMMAQRKDCNMSRTKGQLVAVNSQNGGQLTINNTSVNTKEHLVIDGCDKALMGGNSGSLITSRGSAASTFGVYHWAIGVSNKTLETYPCVSYTGNSGNSYSCPTPPKDESMYRVYNVGTSLFEIF